MNFADFANISGPIISSDPNDELVTRVSTHPVEELKALLASPGVKNPWLQQRTVSLSFVSGVKLHIIACIYNNKSYCLCKMSFDGFKTFGLIVSNCAFLNINGEMITSLRIGMGII